MSKGGKKGKAPKPDKRGTVDPTKGGEREMRLAKQQSAKGNDA